MTIMRFYPKRIVVFVLSVSVFFLSIYTLILRLRQSRPVEDGVVANGRRPRFGVDSLAGPGPGVVIARKLPAANPNNELRERLKNSPAAVLQKPKIPVDIRQFGGGEKIKDKTNTKVKTTVTPTKEMVLRKSSLCPQLLQPRDFVEPQRFQPVASQRSMFVFSVFFDDRHDLIRIIAIGSSSVSGYCQMWYREGDVMKLAGLTIQRLPEGHAEKYIGYYLMCRLPDNRIPYAVSVVRNKCDKPTNMLKVLNAEKVDFTKVKGFGVCMPPFNFKYKRVDQMIENLETNRMLGATRFTFYNHSLSEEVYNVLKPYIQRDIVEVVQWPLPVKAQTWPPTRGKEIHYFGQISNLNDCLYRNQQKVKYVAFTDLDEYAVPRKHGNWSALLQNLESRGIRAASYMFRNVFFKCEWPDDEDMAKVPFLKKLNMEVILKTKREPRIFPPNSRSKNLVEIRKVSVVGVHNIWAFERGSGSHILSETDGLLHHYRNWETKGDKNYLVDRYMHKFKKELVSRVEGVKKELQLL